MVKSANRVISILEYCGTASKGLKHADIARALGIPTSSLSALLEGLVKSKYLAYDPGSRTYTLGPQVLVLAGWYLASFDLIEMAYPVLRALVADIGESASLAVKKEGEVIYIAKVDSPQPLSRIIVVGSCAPLYASASGKVFLAHLSEEELERYLASTPLKPFTGHTVVDSEKLKQDLQKFRAEGLALNDQELNDGIVAMAAPVFDITGCVAATINVPIPRIRFNAGMQARVAASLKTASQKLSGRIG